MARRNDRPLRSGPQSGFNLIALSLILTVAAMLFVAFLPKAADYHEQAAGSVEKLEKVEQAMIAFMAANGRRPCPADGQYAVNTPNFGKEAANPGTCTGGTPSAPLGPDAGTGNVVGGVIPTKSLHLPDDYAFDAWGRRFTYVVDKRATSTGLCLTLQGTMIDTFRRTGKGGIVIQDSTTGNYIDNVMAAYIAHGPSGFGAWTASGGSVAGRINTGVIDQDMQTNAGVDSGFNYSTTNFTNIKVQKERTATFDHTLYYADYLKNDCCVGPVCTQIGFRIDDIAANDGNSGISLAFGDVNGDGIPDLILGIPNSMTNGSGTYDGGGTVYVVFGTKNGFPDPLPLSSLNGSNGFSITDASGWQMAGGQSGTVNGVASGDINGDGVTDVIIGAQTNNDYAGKVYVIFGHTGAWPASLDVGSLNGTNGFAVLGTNFNDQIGSAVAAGDINGDGIADLIIGAAPRAGSGAVYVVFGGHGAWPASFNVSALNGTTGVNGTSGSAITDSNTNQNMGYALATGDVNGDDITDLVIGAPGQTDVGGNVYVVLGHTGAWPASLDVGSLNGSNGFNLVGPAIWVGTKVAVGDINDDGIPDIIIGSQWNGVYTIFGQKCGGAWSTACPASSTIESFMNGTNGFSFDDAWNWKGYVVAAGDVNGDGIADIVIGTDTSGIGGNAGTTYVLFGHSGAWSNMAVSDINGTNGVVFTGAKSDDYSGATVAVGDINGDGIPDIVTTAPYASYSASNSGSTYVFFGKKKNWKSPFNLGGL